MNGPLFNKLTSMPFYPYRIIEHLANDVGAEGFWKLLYYNTRDAYSQPNLSLKQKMDLVWNGQDKQNEYNLFLTYQVENLLLDAKTIMKIYKVDGNPINKNIATLAYEFDIMSGGKIVMVDYDGVPCNRLDLIEMELMKSLNGADVAGAGWLQYNGDLSRLCRTRFNVGNNTNFTGISIIYATQCADNYSDGC